LNPYADQYYDGTSLSPTEVVFIKFKDSLLDADWPSMQAASAYSRWMDAQVLCRHLASLVFTHRVIRLQKIIQQYAIMLPERRIIIWVHHMDA